MSTIDLVITRVSRFFKNIWEWIKSLFCGEPDEGYLLPSHMYDIYYHFKILEKDGKLENMVVGKLESNYFHVQIKDTYYYIKIYKENDTIYTDLYYKQLILEPDEYHKKHTRYGSLEFEVLRAEKDYLFVELPDDLDFV
jgi:hypothetical protein